MKFGCFLWIGLLVQVRALYVVERPKPEEHDPQLDKRSRFSSMYGTRKDKNYDMNWLKHDEDEYPRRSKSLSSQQIKSLYNILASKYTLPENTHFLDDSLLSSQLHDSYGYNDKISRSRNNFQMPSLNRIKRDVGDPKSSDHSAPHHDLSSLFYSEPVHGAPTSRAYGNKPRRSYISYSVKKSRPSSFLGPNGLGSAGSVYKSKYGSVYWIPQRNGSGLGTDRGTFNAGWGDKHPVNVVHSIGAGIHSEVDAGNSETLEDEGEESGTSGSTLVGGGSSFSEKSEPGRIFNVLSNGQHLTKLKIPYADPSDYMGNEYNDLDYYDYEGAPGVDYSSYYAPLYGEPYVFREGTPGRYLKTAKRMKQGALLDIGDKLGTVTRTRPFLFPGRWKKGYRTGYVL